MTAEEGSSTCWVVEDSWACWEEVGSWVCWAVEDRLGLHEGNVSPDYVCGRLNVFLNETWRDRERIEKENDEPGGG